jgi:hypothetical protein
MPEKVCTRVRPGHLVGEDVSGNLFTLIPLIEISNKLMTKEYSSAKLIQSFFDPIFSFVNASQRKQ